MPLNLSRNQIIIVSAIFGVVLFLVLVFLGVIPGLKKQNSGGILGQGEQVILSFWGVENNDFLMPFFENYQKIRPNVRVDYKQINENDCEKTLINALAAGRVPRHNDVPRQLAAQARRQNNSRPAKTRLLFPDSRNCSRQWLFPILHRKEKFTPCRFLSIL